MPYPLFDRSKLRLRPLRERAHDVSLDQVSALDAPIPTYAGDDLGCIARRMVEASRAGSAVIWMMGAHPIKLGLSRYIVDLMERGVLSAVAGGDIWTLDRYGDFILDLEFKLDKDTNSGVFVRTDDIVEWLHTAIEVQILDSYGVKEPSKHDCGGIFDCLAPSENAVKKPGEWNRYVITCKDNKIGVVLNGREIVDMNLDRWTEAGKNPDGTPNKFRTAYQEMSRDGHIGLQYHGHPIWFRNIKIKEL